MYAETTQEQRPIAPRTPYAAEQRVSVTIHSGPRARVKVVHEGLTEVEVEAVLMDLAAEIPSPYVDRPSQSLLGCPLTRKENDTMQIFRTRHIVGITVGTWLAVMSVGCAARQPQADPWEAAAQQANTSASRADAAASRAEAAAKRTEDAGARAENAARRIEAMSERVGTRTQERMRK